jgi:hypothetical protein
MSAILLTGIEDAPLAPMQMGTAGSLDLACSAALSAAHLDAVIDDSLIALHFAQSKPGLQYAGGLPGTEGEYAIMPRRGNHKRAIN